MQALVAWETTFIASFFISPTNNWLANSLLSPECPAESHGWPPNRRRAVIAHGYSGGNPASELGSGDVQTIAWRFSEE